MASGTAHVSGSLGSHFTLHLECSEISVDTANNQSTVSTNMYLTCDSSATGVFNLNDDATWSANINGDTPSGNWTYDYRGNTNQHNFLSSRHTVVNHNNDGSKTISVSCSIDMKNGPYVTTATVSFNLTLSAINRTATISSFSIDLNTDIGFRINVGVSDTCDLLEYSTDGGSSFSSSSGSFTSKSVTLTNLVAGTTYSVVVRVRRQDSQIKTTSSAINGSTLVASGFFFGDIV